MNGKTKGKALR